MERLDLKPLQLARSNVSRLGSSGSTWTASSGSGFVPFVVTFIGFALALLTPAFAQVVLDLPSDLAVANAAPPPDASRRSVAKPPAPAKKPAPPPRKPRSGVPAPGEISEIGNLINSIGVDLLSDETREFWDRVFLADRAHPERDRVETERYITISADPPAPSTLLLSSFNGDAASGGIRAGTTWVGNVTQGAGYIAVGGTARDDNGWGATGLSLNATGIYYITISAQRDPGHAAPSFFIQFEDRNLNTGVFSINTSAFAFGAPTSAQIVIGTWPVGFDFTQIGSWSFGGGGIGTTSFQMTFYNLEFTNMSLTAVPEPAPVALTLGAAALAGASNWRRRVRGAAKSAE